MVTVVVMAAMAISVGVGVGLLGRTPVARFSAPSATVPAADTDASHGMIDVHVSGWVVSPGVVSVPNGSIVADVIDAAGGLRAGADVDQINLAAEAIAGQQVVVPTPGVVGVAGGETGSGLIPINTASASELEDLPGVGPVLAGRIVAFREDNGPFDVAEDLLQVPGIGEAKLASIRDLVQP